MPDPKPNTLTAITFDGVPLAAGATITPDYAGRAFDFTGRDGGEYVTVLLYARSEGNRPEDAVRIEPVEKRYRLPPTLPPDDYRMSARPKSAADNDARYFEFTVAAVVPPPVPTPKPASISGVLFNDGDGDGTLDPGESVTGVRTVTLGAPGRQTMQTTQSKADGTYTFTGMAAGTYRIARVFQKGYTLSNNDKGYVDVTVAAGQAVNRINLGSKLVKVTDGQPLPTTPGDQQPAIRLTVVEGGDAYATAHAVGFDGVREWCSINWNTGKINRPEKIATVNRAVAAGQTAVLTVTVDEHKNRKGERCKDFSVVADQLKALGLNPRVIVQLVNEGQLIHEDKKTGERYGPYWPEGNIVEATQVFAVPIGVKLKAWGYTLACPSITYGTPEKIVEWIDAIFAASPKGLWSYIDGHLYLSDLGAYERVGKCYADLAVKYGVQAISTEWSFKVGNDEFAKVAAKLFAIMDRCFVLHTWFSFIYNEKFNPLNPYALRDGKKTVVLDALAKAMAA